MEDGAIEEEEKTEPNVMHFRDEIVPTGNGNYDPSRNQQVLGWLVPTATTPKDGSLTTGTNEACSITNASSNFISYNWVPKAASPR